MEIHVEKETIYRASLSGFVGVTYYAEEGKLYLGRGTQTYLTRQECENLQDFLNEVLSPRTDVQFKGNLVLNQKKLL